MTDAELWALCESSGFTKSEWWPHKDQTGTNMTLAYRANHEDKMWWWYPPNHLGKVGLEEPKAARARILAGLVEWIGESRSHWTHIKHANGVDIHAAWMGSNHEKIGTGENPTLALLSCYAKHAAKAKEAP